MLFITLTDAEGKRVQVNIGAAAWFGPAPGGKGSLITFPNGTTTLKVAESPDDIFTQINAKLRR